MRCFIFVTSHDYFVFDHLLILCHNISSKLWTFVINPLLVFFGKIQFVIDIYLYCYFVCTFCFLIRVYSIYYKGEELTHVSCWYFSVYELLWGVPEMFLCFMSFYFRSGSGICYQNSSGLSVFGVVGGGESYQLIYVVLFTFTGGILLFCVYFLSSE